METSNVRCLAFRTFVESISSANQSLFLITEHFLPNSWYNQNLAIGYEKFLLVLSLTAHSNKTVSVFSVETFKDTSCNKIELLHILKPCCMLICSSS